MTTLNTIIEEEIETTVRGIDDLQKKYWFENTVTPQDEEIKILLTTAIQRAYEAGKEETIAKERLRAFEILHTYAMKTKNTHALDLIEQAQKDILSPLNK